MSDETDDVVCNEEFVDGRPAAVALLHRQLVVDPMTSVTNAVTVMMVASRRPRRGSSSTLRKVNVVISETFIFRRATTSHDVTFSIRRKMM